MRSRRPVSYTHLQWFSRLAKTYRVYLSAGTMPELGEDGRIYNTAYVFDREGRQIAKHRKIHLFDVDIQGGQYFKESETLSPGNEATVFDTEFGKMGLCICYDFRFPEPVSYTHLYSSFSTLHNYDFDILKIDMGFVRRIEESDKTKSIIDSIVKMAHQMDVRTIAEGAETREQVEFLREKGCDYIQGYY